MAEKLVDKKERRRSLSMFGTSLSSSTSLATAQVHDRSSSDGSYTMKKKSRRNSAFFGRNPSPVRASGLLLAIPRPGTADSELMDRACSTPTGSSDTFKFQRKSFQRSKRASVFGSLRSMHSQEDEDKSVLGHRSKGSSVDEEEVTAAAGFSSRNTLGHVVLHHGEVQTTGSMWRKKSHYLVLTDTHLVRFKSQAKASEFFPTIASSSGRATPVSRQSIVSVASLQEQTHPAHGSDIAGIPLNSIVSVYRVEDGRCQAAIELSYIDERTNKAAFLGIQLADPEEQNLWLIGIRSAAESIRSVDPLPFDQRTIDYAARVLDQERDYEPEHFHLFRVVQRSAGKQSGRASSDDLAKLSATVCYLAIGAHKIHLLPLHKASSRSSVVSLNEVEMGMSFGLMTMTSLWMSSGDDSFQLSFRLPVFGICARGGHCALDPSANGIPASSVAQAAHDIDTSNIRYSIDVDCEDAPCFKLLPPSTKERQRYTALELLAVMRALRYNESFVSISFSGINLDVLQDLRDPYGLDLDAFLTRAGAQVHIAGQDRLSVLSQEIRALALKSKRLRRLDFSFCLTRNPVADGGVRDPGCGIPEAIFPLCRRQLTNVDWIVLNGIKLGESDLDYLVDAASQRASHLRALEVGNCGLSVHDLDLVLSTFTAQESTLEAVNIAGVQGRLSPELFQQQIGYFGQIRKIDLSRVARTSGPEPLIAPETLLNWRLEELSLSQTSVNQQTVESIAAYLASDRSSSLRVLRFDQCGLTGTDVAIFLHSMTPASGKPRDLHLYVSENRLDTDYALLFDAIAKNKGPTHLSMRMIDFKKEEHFRELIEAMRKNTSLKYLDISKASLPYDAGPETCKALQLMFEENETLEELDISGEYAHLDVARFGIGLNEALTGLKKNKSLKVLRLEHQKLGLQGANTLASVLEENSSLREVYCENNDINLQSFTVLVNGLERNKSVLYLPTMDSDRYHSLEKVRREVESVHRDSSAHSSASTASSIRRSIHAAIAVGQPSGGHRLAKHHAPTHGAFAGSHSAQHAPSAPESLRNEVEATLLSLNKKWDNEVTRLRRYLYRNYCLAHGLPLEPGEAEGRDQVDTVSYERPTAAGSLNVLLEGIGKLDLDTSIIERISHTEEPEPESRTESPDMETKEATVESSDCSSPLATMSNLQSERADVFFDGAADSASQDRPTSPLSFSSGKSANLQSKHYAAAPTSSPQFALPVSAIGPAGSISGSIRSKYSTSTVSTSTGTGAPSGRTATGLATSSLRKLLSGRPSAIRGIRQIHGFEESEPESKETYVTSDEPPRIIWSPPQVEL
ncbi:hypothetical protein T310_1436 [Rasamsonia emersonii CBS 393.64]|uniref:PH domain-containing protein n=1 Tax=Rasamsonia emersonii (strain ATCC 16479 / CBS 393.64 / IMI 116815) TaxID=1408163 RepID=A0A0F4Z2D8_RASE3|nr:hypothetical protein T310_1436 [Rasamsonia emersonii CBS 393.64]KKA24535.1 hypothetical protein T310_1436 [Rasamsonia emersonii CBS 393.64]